MIKIVWQDNNIEVEGAHGRTIREIVVANKQYFPAISVNDTPMRVLKRNEKTGLPTSCIQLTWDYPTCEGDEIEFFAPAGVQDLNEQEVEV